MEILTQLLGSDAFINAVVAIVGALAVFFGNKARNSFELATGIQIEEKHMRVLHEAIRTSVEATLRHGRDVGYQNLRDHVVTHLRRSAPDALRALLPDAIEGIVGDRAGAVLDNLIDRYRSEVMQRLES